MSNRISYEIERKCRFLGIDKFFEKPFKDSEVETIIGECLKEAAQRMNRKYDIGA